MTRITPELLLQAYAHGFFPMAESAAAPDVFWLDPERRGIIPLDRFHIPRRLARSIRQDIYEVTTDRAFARVLEGCAETDEKRRETWINDLIFDLYVKLHEMGHGHSVECWEDGRLVGGLYGVSLGAAFFGESMFSRARDASKIALVHLVARLRAGGFELLDTQFVTPHLRQFGAEEIPRAAYRQRLSRAIAKHADYWALPESISGSAAMQAITQTS
ncbi:MAG TPA: leucyl/phenylalanyl-tRNA--protein transferase [Sphingomonadales bacterium]